MYTVLSDHDAKDFAKEIDLYVEVEKHMFKVRPEFKSPASISLKEDGENAHKTPVLAFVDASYNRDTARVTDVRKLDNKFTEEKDLFEVFCKMFVVKLEYKAKLHHFRYLEIRTKETVLVEAAFEKGYKVDTLTTFKGDVYTLTKSLD
jgi:hypothetical protein